uniref:Uncharacterized protein n=1 Tax=Panagrolaimus sp. JU765 TaxID=591449 RepID=A0AC34RR44_9BILA
MGKFKEWCSQHKTLITICSIVISIIFAVIIGIVIWQVVKNCQKPKQPGSEVDTSDHPTTENPLNSTTTDEDVTESPTNEPKITLKILTPAFPYRSGTMIETEYQTISHLIRSLLEENFSVIVTVFFSNCHEIHFDALNGTQLQKEQLLVSSDEIHTIDLFNPCKFTDLGSTIYLIPPCSSFLDIPKSTCMKMTSRARKEYSFYAEIQASSSEIDELVKNIKAAYNF